MKTEFSIKTTHILRSYSQKKESYEIFYNKVREECEKRVSFQLTVGKETKRHVLDKQETTEISKGEIVTKTR